MVGSWSHFESGVRCGSSWLRRYGRQPCSSLIWHLPLKARASAPEPRAASRRSSWPSSFTVAVRWSSAPHLSAPCESAEDRRSLTGTPDAAHVGHDHRAARPEFLHIGCVANPHGVRTRKIPRIDAVRFRPVKRINPNPPRRPSNRLRKRLIDDRLRCLRGPRPLRRGLRLGSGRKQGQTSRKSRRYCRSPDTHLDARPNSIAGPYGLRLPRQRQLTAGPFPA